MLESLQDLRKGLKALIRLERSNQWAEAQRFNKRVFIPSLDLVAEKMGISRMEVRKLL